MTTKNEELKKALDILRKNKGNLGENARIVIFNRLEAELKGRQDKEKEMLENELDWLINYYKEHKTCIQCENGKYGILQRINQIKQRLIQLGE